MANSVKARITTDLQKAKAEGNVRAERIRGIVQAAVSEAVAELKAGSSEVRSIARDAIAAVVEALGDKGADAKEEITASIEGMVDGISYSRREEIAKAQVELQQLQTQIDQKEQTLDSDIDGALVVIEDDAKQDHNARFKSIIDAAISAVKDREEFASLRQQYAKLKAKLAILDANLAARYGERYDDVKQHLESAKVWYEDAKAKNEASGTDPVEKTRSEFETKLGEVGVSLAKKERQVKQHLKELWQTATKL